MGNLEFCVGHGIHAVVGTTGFDDDRLARLRGWLEAAPGHRRAGRPQLLHRRDPDDALRRRGRARSTSPSRSSSCTTPTRPTRPPAPPGVRRPWSPPRGGRPAAGPIPDATSTSLDGARGADVDGIRVHGLRIRGLVAHQEVILGGEGETLTIRHDSLDRVSFTPGVLLGPAVASRAAPGLTVGLESFMGLDRG